MTSFTTIDLEFGAAARQAWHPSEKRASSGPAPAPAPAPVDGSIARVHAMARVRLVHVRVLAAFTSTLMGALSTGHVALRQKKASLGGMRKSPAGHGPRTILSAQQVGPDFPLFSSHQIPIPAEDLESLVLGPPQPKHDPYQACIALTMRRRRTFLSRDSEESAFARPSEEWDLHDANALVEGQRFWLEAMTDHM
ncbi:uncharacterized protein SEPMUDRAFT_117647 [Sphaerulina musiva SO2202]|uniref:Uncharacterized protein n=1 Tax=Sphaerulina musiva (strain SO2202) TaxID=692275 RepID=N1QET9_SPHMS|nr:uncharacterized protein SEPMUDRAFT_117647 [Sphaerulina musiva SO2202]EMF11668.1 hypothetical protein SEPMUDRAFT_117647 [Sphaerulina musiva SO2202]